MSLPNFKVAELLRTRERVEAALLECSAGKCVYSNFDSIVNAVLPLFMDNCMRETKHVEALHSILMLHKDALLSDRKILREVSAHIAGWHAELAKGIPFRDWNRKEPVWAPLFIESVERYPMKDKRIFQVVFSSHAGVTTGSTYTKLFTPKFIQFVIRKCGGARWEKYLEEDLSRLWVTALLVNIENKVQFKMVHASSAQIRLNKPLLEGRIAECSGGYRKGRCMHCPLTVSQCRLSRHTRVFPKSVCVCKNPKPHMGYIVRDGICMYCLSAGRINEEKRKRVPVVVKTGVELPL